MVGAGLKLILALRFLLAANAEYGVPFIAFRSLSDLAGGDEGANELPTFFQLASDNSAAVVQRFLTLWTPPR